jgi:hypothetical protein
MQCWSALEISQRAVTTMMRQQQNYWMVLQAPFSMREIMPMTAVRLLNIQTAMTQPGDGISPEPSLFPAIIQYFNNPPAYYAYNLGAWRIYALDSEIDTSAGGAQGTWLQSDLAANPKACVLAYWHKPRWSSGTTHGSDSGMQAIWQILYNAGADVVINGHEHNYERFAQMNATGATVSQGLREFVVGTGGVGHYSFGSALASSEVRNASTFGVLKMTLHSGSYDWQFIPIAGSTFTDSGSANCH